MRRGAQKRSLVVCTGGAPWRQGCTESSVKTVKKSLFFAVGRQKLSIIELQTRPTHPDDGCYLSPNDMLLEKSAGGCIVKTEERDKLGRRLSLVENVLNGFWKRWQILYMYSMAALKVDQETEMFKRVMWFW